MDVPINGACRRFRNTSLPRPVFPAKEASMRNPKTAVGIAVGIAIGAGIGASMDNIGMGVGIGLALGLALGSAWQQASRDEDE